MLSKQPSGLVMSVSHLETNSSNPLENAFRVDGVRVIVEVTEEAFCDYYSVGCDDEIVGKLKDVREDMNSGIMVWLAKSSSRCLLYTSPSPRDKRQSRMPSSA